MAGDAVTNGSLICREQGRAELEIPRGGERGARAPGEPISARRGTGRGIPLQAALEDTGA